MRETGQVQAEPEAAEPSSRGLASPGLVPGSAVGDFSGPAGILALQRAIGNTKVARLLARQGAATAGSAEAAGAANADVLRWPDVLPAAQRDSSHELVVTLQTTRAAPRLTNEDAGGPLSPGSTAAAEVVSRARPIVDAIRTNRQALDTSFLVLEGYKPRGQDTVIYGYKWADAAPDTTTPAELTAAPAQGEQPLVTKRRQAQLWIWQELAGEGGSLSINAYDEARFTWGRGVTAAGGQLQSFIADVGSRSETFRTGLLSYGVRVNGGVLEVVNVTTGAVERGEAALRLTQAKPEILAAFKTVGSANRQQVVDAQWTVIKQGAGKVPDAVLNATPPWPKESIQMLAHVHHASSSYGWGQLQTHIDQGAPDAGAIWTTWMRFLAGSPEANGCYMVSAQDHHANELARWAGGAAKTALAAKTRGPFRLTKDQVKSLTQLSGQVAMIMPGGQTFSVWPADVINGSPLSADDEAAVRAAASGGSAARPPGSPTPAGGAVQRARDESRGAEHAPRRALLRDVLARDPAGSSPSIAAWAAAQDNWGVLDDSLTLAESQPPGSRVTLQGEPAVQIEISDATLAQLRQAVRHRIMEWIYKTYHDFDHDLATFNRLDTQSKMRVLLGPPYRALLRHKPEEERFEYPKDAPNGTAVIAATAAVAGLLAEGGAEDALANLSKDKDAPHRAADAASGLGADDEWCGAFAFMELSEEGLKLPLSLIGNPLLGTAPPAPGNLDGFFLYMPAMEVKVGDSWISLEQYHEQRGSKRRFQVLPASGSDFDGDTSRYQPGGGKRLGLIDDLGSLVAQPGDIVLIDNAKGTYADHITLCRTYDSATHTLTTIGGNEGDAHPVHASGAWELDKNPPPSNKSGKESRVYAVAGFSLVDFEPHTYRKAARR